METLCKTLLNSFNSFYTCHILCCSFCEPLILNMIIDSNLRLPFLVAALYVFLIPHYLFGHSINILSTSLVFTIFFTKFILWPWVTVFIFKYSLWKCTLWHTVSHRVSAIYNIPSHKLSASLPLYIPRRNKMS